MVSVSLCVSTAALQENIYWCLPNETRFQVSPVWHWVFVTLVNDSCCFNVINNLNSRGPFKLILVFKWMIARNFPFRHCWDITFTKRWYIHIQYIVTVSLILISSSLSPSGHSWCGNCEEEHFFRAWQRYHVHDNGTNKHGAQWSQR